MTASSAPERLKVAEYSIFYEVVDGALFRRMEPIELAYARSGSGSARVLLLHSLGGASGTFAAVRAALEGRCDVVTLDLRGFGESPRPTHEYTVDLWLNDVGKLIGVLGEPAPVVYGHGVGAAVALAAAAKGLVLGVAVSGVALEPGEPASLAPVAQAGDRGDDLRPALTDLTGIAPLADDLTAQIVSRAIRAWQAFDGAPLLAQLRVPMLVLASGDDRLTPRAAPGGADRLAEQTGARLVAVEGAHEVPRLAPGAVVAALSTWINEEVR